MAGRPTPIMARTDSTAAEGILISQAEIDTENVALGTKPEDIYGIPGRRFTHHLEELVKPGRTPALLNLLIPVLSELHMVPVRELPSGPSFYEGTRVGHGHPLGAFGSRDLPATSISPVSAATAAESKLDATSEGTAAPMTPQPIRRQASIQVGTPVRLDRLGTMVNDRTPPDEAKIMDATAAGHHELDQRLKKLTSTLSGQFLAKHQDCLAVDPESPPPNLATLLIQSSLKLMAKNNEEQDNRLTYHIPPHPSEMVIDCPRKLVALSKTWPDYNPETGEGFTPEQKMALILLVLIIVAAHDAFYRGKRGIDEMTCADTVVRMLGLDEALADARKDEARRDLIRLIQLLLVGGTLPVFGNTDGKPTMLAEISSPYVTMPATMPAELKAIIDIAKVISEMDVHRTESPELFSAERIARFEAATPHFADIKDEVEQLAIAALTEAGFDVSSRRELIHALTTKVGQNVRTQVEMEGGLVAGPKPKKPEEPVKPNMPVAPNPAAFGSDIPGSAFDETAYQAAQATWKAECATLQSTYQRELKQYKKELRQFNAYQSKVKVAKASSQRIMSEGARVVREGGVVAMDVLGNPPINLLEGFSGGLFSEKAFAERFGNTYRHENPEVRKSLWEAHALFLEKLKGLKEDEPKARKLTRYLLLNAGAQDGVYFEAKILDPRFDIERIVDALMQNPDNTWNTDEILQIGLGELAVPVGLVAVATAAATDVSVAESRDPRPDPSPAPLPVSLVAAGAAESAEVVLHDGGEEAKVVGSGLAPRGGASTSGAAGKYAVAADLSAETAPPATNTGCGDWSCWSFLFRGRGDGASQASSQSAALPGASSTAGAAPLSRVDETPRREPGQ